MISQAASEPSEVCANVHPEGIISHSASELSEVRANVHSEGAIGMRSEGLISQSASWPCELRANVHFKGTISQSASGPSGLGAAVHSEGMINQAAYSKGTINQSASGPCELRAHVHSKDSQREWLMLRLLLDLRAYAWNLVQHTWRPDASGRMLCSVGPLGGRLRVSPSNTTSWSDTCVRRFFCLCQSVGMSAAVRRIRYYCLLALPPWTFLSQQL